MGKRIESFREIGGHYDVALCDVWGVLHNGVSAYPDAPAALEAARGEGLTVVLITNSPALRRKWSSSCARSAFPTAPMTASSPPAT